MRALHPLAVPAAVAAAFGLILAGLFVVEIVSPAAPRNRPSAPAAPVAAAARAPAEVPAQQPARLDVRAELFEKCHRALVEWKGDSTPLQTEIKLLQFKVKDGDERKLLQLFKDIVPKLNCKAYLEGSRAIQESEMRKWRAEIEKAGPNREFLEKSVFGVKSRAWLERGWFSPDEEWFQKLKQQLPDLQLLEAESVTIRGEIHTPQFIDVPRALAAIDQQILAVETAIGLALAG